MINKAVVIGNITRDPELRKTKDNKSTCGFTIAVQRNFKNADDEYDSDFINCVAWSHSAEYLCNYAHKGDMIAVSGRIQTRKYKNQEGNTIYVTEIMCDDVAIVHSRDKKQGTAVFNGNEAEESQKKAVRDVPFEPDDLPFY